MNNELREALAALVHESIGGWAKHFDANSSALVHAVKHASIKYRDLPDPSKIYAQCEADRILSTIGTHFLGHNKGV